MKREWLHKTLMLAVAAFVLGSMPATAGHINVQCPGDNDGDAKWDSPGETQPPGVKCMHLAAGDGFVSMADGTPLYMFGFDDATGQAPETVMDLGILAGNFPAPTIALDQGDEFYLTLTNVGMMIRPDLFDPHTVHWHGFPQSSTVFDGLPESAISINMGATLTYYYKVMEPGTYMYHCHVEATEHMQMGMLGNLYVRAGQDGTPYEYPVDSGRFYSKFAYNDGDGSTGYDSDVAIQIGSFDSAFHNASESVQPLPFAMMRDDYAMLNGRSYPDTTNPAALAPPVGDINGGEASQPISAVVQGAVGDRILLRISNLNVTRYYTLGTLGIPMQVVGRDAKLLRGPDGKDLYYTTNSITIGGGESVDVILDTEGVVPGTYFLYSKNLNYLSNAYNTDSPYFSDEDGALGGMMTEIQINAAR